MDFQGAGLKVKDTVAVYATNFEKLEGHIASGAFIHPSIHSSRLLMHDITLETWMLLFWNFLYGFLMKK